MFDMRFKTAERRCLVHGLKMLLKDARNEKKGRIPIYYNDNYWNITVKRKKPSSLEFAKAAAELNIKNVGFSKKAKKQMRKTEGKNNDK